MNTQKPIKLTEGDVVGIVSPSGPVFSKRDLTRGMKALESIGLKPRLAPKALEVHANYQAGRKSDRLHDLKAMFLDDEVRAIFCASGGYSAIQLLPDIDWRTIQKNPKVFVGFSDITILLNTIHEKTGLITFHGPNVEDLDLATKGGKYSLKMLENAVVHGKTENLDTYTEWKVLREGRVEGEFLGGNLSVLLSLMGTPYEPKWEGKILFWEEDNETVEGIDNFLWRLRVAKVFKKIEGMVVGKVTRLQSIEEDGSAWGDLEKPPTLEDVIIEATNGYNFPILYNVDIGHEVPSLTLPIGAKALLDCPKKGRVGNIALTDSYLAEPKEPPKE